MIISFSLSLSVFLSTYRETNVPLHDNEDVSYVSITSAMCAFSDDTEKMTGYSYIPHVIEPSFGIGRILYSLLEQAYWTREGDEQRAVLSLSPALAPVKCVVIPKSADKLYEPYLDELVRRISRAGLACRLDASSTVRSHFFFMMSSVVFYSFLSLKKIFFTSL